MPSNTPNTANGACEPGTTVAGHDDGSHDRQVGDGGHEGQDGQVGDGGHDGKDGKGEKVGVNTLVVDAGDVVDVKDVAVSDSVVGYHQVAILEVLDVPGCHQFAVVHRFVVAVAVVVVWPVFVDVVLVASGVTIFTRKSC